jgi:hypothetical protein
MVRHVRAVQAAISENVLQCRANRSAAQAFFNLRVTMQMSRTPLLGAQAGSNQTVSRCSRFSESLLQHHLSLHDIRRQDVVNPGEDR